MGLLGDGRASCHPWIVGALALGPGMRLDVIDDLTRLPMQQTVPDGEVLRLVQRHSVRGVGWVDMQLLVSSLEARAALWTADHRLQARAERFEVAYCPG